MNRNFFLRQQCWALLLLFVLDSTAIDAKTPAATDEARIPAEAVSSTASDPRLQSDILWNPHNPETALTLEDCYRLALRQSEAYARYQLEMAKTTSDFLKASGEVIGDIHFRMTSFDQEPQKGATDSTGATQTATRSRRRERKFVLSQPLFQGFRAYGVLAGAKDLKDRRLAELNRAAQLLYLDVAVAFYAVLKYEKDIEITSQVIQLFTDRVTDLEEREKIGRSRAGETVTARARKKIFEATLAEEQGAWKQQRSQLEFLTGVSMQDRKLLDVAFPEIAFVDVNELLSKAEKRDDVLASAYAAELADSAMIVAKSGLWPEITLDSNLYEKREGFQSSIDWDVLFTIDIPIFKGGTVAGEILEQRIEIRKARLVYNEALRLARLDIQQAYDGYVSAKERDGYLKDAVEDSKKNYEIQKEDYSKTLVTNLDVLEALQDYNDTLLESNRVHYELKENFVRLQIAIGEKNESV